LSAGRRLARWGKQVAGRAGLQIRRAGAENRFDGMLDTLRQLRRRGYAPGVVIDGGANVGQWTTLASAVFPEARFHLIEPQAECHERLESAFSAPRYTLHRVALTAPGVSRVSMVADGTASTGAAVVIGGDGLDLPTRVVPATTLDDLLANAIRATDRALLKLDLESHELEALRGATALLNEVEVILCEVSFFDTESQGHPLFADIFDHLKSAASSCTTLRRCRRGRATSVCGSGMPFSCTSGVPCSATSPGSDPLRLLPLAGTHPRRG
jgi:FkbM family methyltransferase